MPALRVWFAALAQLVEHRIRNAEVGCSSHLSGTTQCFSTGLKIKRFDMTKTITGTRAIVIAKAIQ